MAFPILVRPTGVHRVGVAAEKRLPGAAFSCGGNHGDRMKKIGRTSEDEMAGRFHRLTTASSRERKGPGARLGPRSLEQWCTG